jgi:hypothetical protein
MRHMRLQRCAVYLKPVQHVRRRQYYRGVIACSEKRERTESTERASWSIVRRPDNTLKEFRNTMREIVHKEPLPSPCLNAPLTFVKRNADGRINRSYLGGFRVNPSPTNVALVTTRFQLFSAEQFVHLIEQKRGGAEIKRRRAAEWTICHKSQADSSKPR